MSEYNRTPRLKNMQKTQIMPSQGCSRLAKEERLNTEGGVAMRVCLGLDPEDAKSRE